MASSVVFLIVAMGSALSLKGLLAQRPATASHRSSTSPSTAALLSSAGKSIVLLSEIPLGKDGTPVLSALDLAFLREAGKIGTVSFGGFAANLPAVKERRVQEIRALLANATPPVEAEGEFSRVFVPGHQGLYLISRTGEVFSVDAQGNRLPVEGH